jgi:hypothetical protein
MRYFVNEAAQAGTNTRQWHREQWYRNRTVAQHAPWLREAPPRHSSGYPPVLGQNLTRPAVLALPRACSSSGPWQAHHSRAAPESPRPAKLLWPPPPALPGCLPQRLVNLRPPLPPPSALQSFLKSLARPSQAQHSHVAERCESRSFAPGSSSACLTLAAWARPLSHVDDPYARPAAPPPLSSPTLLLPRASPPSEGGPGLRLAAAVWLASGRGLIRVGVRMPAPQSTQHVRSTHARSAAHRPSACTLHGAQATTPAHPAAPPHPAAAPDEFAVVTVPHDRMPPTRTEPQATAGSSALGVGAPTPMLVCSVLRVLILPPEPLLRHSGWCARERSAWLRGAPPLSCEPAGSLPPGEDCGCSCGGGGQRNEQWALGTQTSPGPSRPDGLEADEERGRGSPVRGQRSARELEPALSASCCHEAHVCVCFDTGVWIERSTPGPCQGRPRIELASIYTSTCGPCP